MYRSFYSVVFQYFFSSCLIVLFSCLFASFTEAGGDIISIGKKEFIVPPPWAGNRLVEQKFEYEDFRKVPEIFAKDGSKIYLLTDAQESLVEMLEAASEAGVLIQVSSGYRSSGYQKKIFQRMFKEGREFDDIIRYVAPPGYSEHMLGTAVDFSPSNWRFAPTEQYQWLRENGRNFGFHETYPEISEKQIPWEAWHWRFLGNPTADSK